jgi:hypothetical protein
MNESKNNMKDNNLPFSFFFFFFRLKIIRKDKLRSERKGNGFAAEK